VLRAAHRGRAAGGGECTPCVTRQKPGAAPPLTRLQARGGVRANAATGNVKQVCAPWCYASCLFSTQMLTCSAVRRRSSWTKACRRRPARSWHGPHSVRCITRPARGPSTLTAVLSSPDAAALLTTTNASCAVLVRDGAVVCARGTLSAAALAGGLGGLAATLAPTVARVRADGSGGVQVRYTACMPLGNDA
jgi:hypothetical protein